MRTGRYMDCAGVYLRTMLHCLHPRRGGQALTDIGYGNVAALDALPATCGRLSLCSHGLTPRSSLASTMRRTPLAVRRAARNARARQSAALPLAHSTRTFFYNSWRINRVRRAGAPAVSLPFGRDDSHTATWHFAIALHAHTYTHTPHIHAHTCTHTAYTHTHAPCSTYTIPLPATPAPTHHHTTHTHAHTPHTTHTHTRTRTPTHTHTHTHTLQPCTPTILVSVVYMFVTWLVGIAVRSV